MTQCLSTFAFSESESTLELAYGGTDASSRVFHRPVEAVVLHGSFGATGRGNAPGSGRDTGPDGANLKRPSTLHWFRSGQRW